jgi:hypothetical protein
MKRLGSAAKGVFACAVGCAAAFGVVASLGEASARADGCPPVFAPVYCFSDHQIYDNQCFADQAGASLCYDMPTCPPAGDPPES